MFSIPFSMHCTDYGTDKENLFYNQNPLCLIEQHYNKEKLNVDLS